MYLQYQKARYLSSALDLNQLPADQGAEVAFMGVSNAGKSSAINTLTGIKHLAHTSKTPGRTQMINFFLLDHTHRLVDLPGYGYAQVPRKVQARWRESVHQYLQMRESLRGIILVMDIRHPLKVLDQTLVSWAVSCHLPLHILLTKSDKLCKHKAYLALDRVSCALQYCKQTVTVSAQLFSARDRTGLESAITVLNQWMLSP